MKKTKKGTIRKMFSTPKNALIALSILVLTLAILGTLSAFSVYAIAKNSSVGEETALNNAYTAAGISSEDVDAVKSKFKFDDGRFVYEVEFYSKGKEYEYKIHSKNGSVIEFETSNNVALPENSLSVNDAKSIALNHATLLEKDVTFTKAKLEKSKGSFKYELEFQTESKKYEYDINAIDGQIIKSESKIISLFASDDNGKVISVEDAKKSALTHAGITEAEFTKAKLDEEDGTFIYEINFIFNGKRYEYEINAENGQVVKAESKSEAPEHGFDIGFPEASGKPSDPMYEKPFEPQNPDGIGQQTPDNELHKPEQKPVEEGNKPENAPQNPPIDDKPTPRPNAFIGTEEAKRVALDKAQVSLKDVIFTKTKLEKEKGGASYEIEFIHKGKEYEFTIDAFTGEILEFDS